MWKISIRFIGRYLAIGILVGIGFFAVEEFYWQFVGNERTDKLQQSINELMESFLTAGPSLQNIRESVNFDIGEMRHLDAVYVET